MQQRTFQEACILTTKAQQDSWLWLSSSSEASYAITTTVHVKQIEGNMNKLIFYVMILKLSPFSFFLSSSSPPATLRLFSTPFHWTVKMRLCSCWLIPVFPPLFSLCEAISDYFVITSVLGVCSQTSFGRTWAKLFRARCFQVWIYMGVKCFFKPLWHRPHLSIVWLEVKMRFSFFFL